MLENIRLMLENTINFMGTPAGVTILILLAIVWVEFIIILIVLKILFKVLNKDKIKQVVGATNDKA